VFADFAKDLVAIPIGKEINFVAEPYSVKPWCRMVVKDCGGELSSQANALVEAQPIRKVGF
jgi:hypothetical protein